MIYALEMKKVEVHYEKDVKYGGEWESFVPVTTDRENPSTYDALLAFNGAVSTMFANVFNIEVVNGHKSTGTAMSVCWLWFWNYF